MSRSIAIVGAGPAALIAAEKLASAGHSVSVYDNMPSPARKLLIAGRGGLNLTHSEPLEPFLARYGSAADWLAPSIQRFTPAMLREWCDGLGGDSFIGSSGRVFPRRMKAVALLRAWLARLQKLNVRYYSNHAWIGWDGNALRFSTKSGEIRVAADATLFALGGASWPRLGSNGNWVSLFACEGIAVSPLKPANCGFAVPWSDYFNTRFVGTPLKPVAVTHEGVTRQGEAMMSAHGIEGGVIYALGAAIREAILRDGKTTITLDLRPAMSVGELQKKLGTRGSKSLSAFLKSASFAPIAAALLHETGTHNTASLAHTLKTIPLTLTGIADIKRAISTAGGVMREAVTDQFMLRAKPGHFVAGEMLDWEAPTGGYLLQACFSTAVAAAEGMLEHLRISA